MYPTFSVGMMGHAFKPKSLFVFEGWRDEVNSVLQNFHYNLIIGEETESLILVFFKLLLKNCSSVHEDIIILEYRDIIRMACLSLYSASGLGHLQNNLQLESGSCPWSEFLSMLLIATSHFILAKSNYIKMHSILAQIFFFLPNLYPNAFLYEWQSWHPGPPCRSHYLNSSADVYLFI